jgi:hypothetical protein
MKVKIIWDKFKKRYIFTAICGLLVLGCSSIQFTPSPNQEVDSVATYVIQTVTAKANQVEVSLIEITEGIPLESTPEPTSVKIEDQLPTDISTPIFIPIDEETGESIDIASLIDSNSIFSEGDIKIYKPGNYSMVSSPFRITADVVPDEKSQIQVRLVGEDGRILAQKKLYVTVLSGNRTALFSTELEFEIESIAEAGRVEISVEDEFGRLRSLNSVDVILMSTGQSNYNYTGEYYSEIIIQQPFSNMKIEGDTLIVSGIAKANSEKSIQLEVLDENGVQVGEAAATLVIPPNSLHGLFAGNINYLVTVPTNIRLLIKIPGARIPGFSFVQSVSLLIGP